MSRMIISFSSGLGLALWAAVLSAPAALAIETGVNVHLPATNMTDPVPALDRAVEMRLTWGRMDFRWEFVEPTPMNDVATEGHWDIMDASIYAMRSRQMQVLAILQAPAGWATTNGQEDAPL